MFVSFSEDAKKAIKYAKQEMMELKHPYIGSEHLLLSILNQDKLIKKIFARHGITYSVFKNKLISIVGIGSKKSKYVFYTPLLKRILSNAVIEAKEARIKIISPMLLTLLIVEEESGVACSILDSLNVNFPRLIFDIRKEFKNKSGKKRKLLLDELGKDLTLDAKKGLLDPMIGREKEVENLIQILLRKKKNNPILIGPAGVGKTAIVEGVASLIAQNKVPNYLKGKRIISLNVFSVVAGTKYRGEFEEKMKNLIRELEENKDIILFIDEVHTIVGAGGAEGAIDASNIFKPALARGSIKIIGATTIDEYTKYIEPDSALSRRFQKIDVKEPSKEDMINIISKIKKVYVKHHNVVFPKKLISDMLSLSNRYITDRYEPDKSIDILDEVCAKVSLKESNEDKRLKLLNKNLKIVVENKNKAFKDHDYDTAYKLKIKENSINESIDNCKLSKKVISIEDIKNTIKSKNNCLILDVNDNKYFKTLEDRLNKKILGRRKSIKKFIYFLKRKSINDKKEVFSVLISGKKGCGKTYFSNEVGKMLFKNVINVDLSDYKSAYSIRRLIGSENNNKDSLAYKVRTNPASAIIIDNVSAANSEVLNIICRILKDGVIEDINGREVNFTNSIIIINETIKNNSSLGFNNKNEESKIPKEMLKLIKNRISFEALEDKVFGDVINSKINELSKKNNVKLDKDIKENIINELKKCESLSKLDELISENIEKIILKPDTQEKLVI